MSGPEAPVPNGGSIDIVNALLGEHGVLYAWFDAVEETLKSGPAAAEVAGLARRMASVLGSHARVENELLLDEAARRGAEEGPLAVMRREHEEIEELLGEAVAASAADPDRASGLLREAIAVARDHFEKEELAAFPLAARVLGPGALAEAGARWAERRRVRLGG